MPRPPPRSTLFPYTTLFRSVICRERHLVEGDLVLPGHFSPRGLGIGRDRKSTRLNSSHVEISYAVFCLKKKRKRKQRRGHLNEEREVRGRGRGCTSRAL